MACDFPWCTAWRHQGASKRPLPFAILSPINLVLSTTVSSASRTIAKGFLWWDGSVTAILTAFIATLYPWYANALYSAEVRIHSKPIVSVSAWYCCFCLRASCATTSLATTLLATALLVTVWFAVALTPSFLAVVTALADWACVTIATGTKLFAFTVAGEFACTTDPTQRLPPMQATITYHAKLLDFITASYSHVTFRANSTHHIILHSYTKILLKFVYY